MEAHLPTRVGILLTVGGAELSVRHGYGGGVGYDMLVPGLSYRRFINIFLISSLHSSSKFVDISSIAVSEVLIFINRAPGNKGLL